MKILLNKNDLNEALNKVSNIGFVPTMGSLHKGHISLIKKCLNECKYTVVSIFINPQQFNNKKDYKKYPRNIKKDLSILKKLKIDFVFLPDEKTVYSEKSNIKIQISKKNNILCAKFRKGHFVGVLEVMDRLTKLIKPNKIYMGEKDYQQLHLVKNFIEKRYKSKIIPCKTIRDKYKLALSSRNFLLKKRYLKKARDLTNNIINFKKKLKREKNIKKLTEKKMIELSKRYKVKFDYLEVRDKKNLKLSKEVETSKLFFAYSINNIRLIDNF